MPQRLRKKTVCMCLTTTALTVAAAVRTDKVTWRGNGPGCAKHGTGTESVYEGFLFVDEALETS